MSERIWKSLYLSGYFATATVLLGWYTWLAPARHLPMAFILLVLLLPWLLPVRGLLAGRRYTVGWSLFLSLAYFTHGVVEAYSVADERYLGMAEIGASLLWFVAGIGYIRSSRRSQPQH